MKALDSQIATFFFYERERLAFADNLNPSKKKSEIMPTNQLIITLERFP